jgi:RNA polymerase-binding transcription factor DksA
MDDADRAQVEQERALARQIAAARGVEQKTNNGRRVTECVECAEPIEPPRIEHGFACCFDCANRLERLRRLGAV